MTLRHLRIFVTVYQEMSITKAAAKLHLAQPSVSLAVKELEEAYHIRLFDRINRRLFITENGEVFYSYASHIVNLFDDMENHMTSSDGPVRFSIGSSITIGNYIVPQVISGFREEHPSCEIKVNIKNSQQIIQAVLKNELDFGLIEDTVQNEQLEAIPFLSDRMYFVCGSNHPLVSKKQISLEDICTYPLFLREKGSGSREITDGLLKSHQMKPLILWESISNQALIHAVEDNRGITVMSEKLVEDAQKKGKIALLPFYPDVFCRDFTLIYHKKKFMSPTLLRLIESFRDLPDIYQG